MQVIRGFVSKETVVLRRWGLETIVWFYQGFGFLRGASLYKAFFENPLRGGGGGSRNVSTQAMLAKYRCT